MAKFNVTHEVSGDTQTLTYASTRNLFKFGLRKDTVPKGPLVITDAETGKHIVSTIKA